MEGSTTLDWLDNTIPWFWEHAVQAPCKCQVVQYVTFQYVTAIIEFSMYDSFETQYCPLQLG